MDKPQETNNIHKMAVVEAQDIGHNVTIQEFAIVRNGVKIGDNVVIHAHAVIEPGVEIGNGVEVFPGAYIGREPKGAGAVSRQPVFERTVRIGDNSSIGPYAIIYCDVEIGQYTLIGDGASIREKCRIGSHCIISRYVTINYNAQVGNRSKVMDLTHVTGNCRIGADVFISTGVSMANDNCFNRFGYSNSMLGPVIEDGAQVGAQAVLLPGMVIGRGAIVGSGAVVARDVEAGTLAMSVPARFVRSVQSEERGEQSVEAEQGNNGQ